MNFAIDNPAPAIPPQSPVTSPTDELADMMLTRIFLGAEEISGATAHAPKNKVTVRVEQVFRTKSSVYVHYLIENNTKRPYRVQEPAALALEPSDPVGSLPTLMRKQLDQHGLEQFGGMRQFPLPVAHAESETRDLQPGEATQGIVAIRKDLASPVIVQLVFDAQVKATVVL